MPKVCVPKSAVGGGGQDLVDARLLVEGHRAEAAAGGAVAARALDALDGRIDGEGGGGDEEASEEDESAHAESSLGCVVGPQDHRDFEGVLASSFIAAGEAQPGIYGAGAVHRAAVVSSCRPHSGLGILRRLILESGGRTHGVEDPGHGEARRGPRVQNPSQARRFGHRHRRRQLQDEPVRRDRRRGGAPAQGGPRRRGGGGLDRRREVGHRDPGRPRHGGRPRRAGPPRRPARPGGGLGPARQGGRAGEARPDPARQAVDRRRPEPGRPVPGGAPRPAPGHLRLQDREPGERGRAEEGARA